jgi:hypothetical protein
MVSPEALKLNEILRNAPKAVDMDHPHQREAREHAEDMTSEPQGVTYDEAYAVDGLWATPQTWKWPIGDHVPLWRRLRDLLAPLTAQARRSPRERLRASALVPRYHLAPERPFPKPLEQISRTTGH